jgi:RNA polymerase sigma factor (sigma-70 family)
MQTATAAETGGRQTESEVVQSCDRRIAYLAQPFAKQYGVAIQDLIQEGRIALLESAREWDPTGGASIWTFGRRAVFWAMLQLVARERKEPSRDLDGIVGLAQKEEDCDERDPWIDRLPSAEPSPEEIAKLGEDLAMLEEEIDALSDVERDVLWRVFGESKDVRAIAEEMSTSKSDVDRIKHRAIERLRERIETRS